MPDGAWLPRLGRVGWREWLGLGAAVLGVVASLLSWTVLSSADPAEAHELAAMPRAETRRNAFGSGFYAWGSVSLTVLMGVAVAVLGQFRTVRRAGLPQLWLVTAVVTVALSVIGFFAMGLQFGSEGASLLDTLKVDIDAGPGRWLGLAAALLTLVAAALDVGAFRREQGRSRGRRVPRE